MLYGATMLAVQGVEHSVAWLYLVATVDPSSASNASIQRQWRNVTTRSWGAFQTGSAGMKLNDINGLKGRIPEQLREDADRFIKTRRNQLAHRFLIEQLVQPAEGPPRFASGSILRLVETTIEARQLIKRLFAEADAIRASWPRHSDPPDDVREFMELLGRVTMLKRFPADPPAGEPTRPEDA
jgi:hypothetical protein